jgi:hypothetical protein
MTLSQKLFDLTSQFLPVLGCASREAPVVHYPNSTERIDEVDGSERKDNARTKNHENFCGQDALLILWALLIVAAHC